MSDKQIYMVQVDTGGSFHTFETFHTNLLENIQHGNTRHVFFVTVDGREVMVPDRFMVVISKKEDKNND